MTRPKPKLTRETLKEAMKPVNNCKVAAFRETLSPEELEVLDEALAMKKDDLSANSLREWLLGVGFDESIVPGSGAIQDHRNGRRPCRCRG